jgi:hypothetical protein
MDRQTNVLKLILAFSQVFVESTPKRINTVMPALFFNVNAI